jgi:inositol 1,4,5-triphosphate receptor type 3
MFQKEPKGEQKDLLLNNEDIIVKILTYLQNWELNKASKANVIFILRVLSAILKPERISELIPRQILYDKLSGAKIIIILIWEEQEMEPEYLCTLMKFLIRMVQGGNDHV